MWNFDACLSFLTKHHGQPIELTVSKEGPCLETMGLYDLLDQFQYDDVIIITDNALEKHDRYQIQKEFPFKFFYTAQGDWTEYHYWTGEKTFGVIYNRPLWHRIGLAAYCQEHYLDRTLFNIRADVKDPDSRKLFEICELFEHSPRAFKSFSKVFDTWPVQIERLDRYLLYGTTRMHTDRLCKFYPQLLIDIVAETWCHGNTFSLTEKQIRPMVLSKPFISMASRNCLGYLKQMGFKTFSNYWDESYDGFEGATRFEKILNLIDKIAQWDNNHLMEIYRDMQPILEHNHQLIQEKKFNLHLDYIK